MTLRRSLVALLVALALMIPFTALAEDATPGVSEGAATPAATPGATPPATGDGVISGTVKNGTPGGGSVAGLEVKLTRYQEMQPTDEYTTTTGEDGSYRFENLPVNEGEGYIATVRYQGYDYYSSLLLLSDQPQTTADLTVYEPTDDPSVIEIASRGVIIAGTNTEVGALEIFEIVSLDNSSDRAYVGQNGTVLRIPLPPGATQIIQQPQSGFNFGQLRFEDGNLITTGLITPGSHDAMFSYLVPYQGTKATLEIGTAQPTDALSVLIEDGTYNISSPSMQDAGTANIAGTVYHVISAQQPVVGDVIAVTVDGLPKPGSTDTDRGPLYAGIAAVVGLAVAGVLTFQAVRARRQPAEAASDAAHDLPDDPESLEAERLALAAELNKLDEERARGEIDEETYQEERAEIVEELRAISLRMRGLKDSGA